MSLAIAVVIGACAVWSVVAAHDTPDTGKKLYDTMFHRPDGSVSAAARRKT